MAIRDDWPEGQKFRVVKEGGRLDGMVAMMRHRDAYEGWRCNLAVGDVITCLGYGPGWGSDPGYGIHFTSDKVKEAHAFHVEFLPSAGSMWSSHPADGFLEALSEVPSK